MLRWLTWVVVAVIGSGCCSSTEDEVLPVGLACSVDDAGTFLVEALDYSSSRSDERCLVALDGGLHFTLHVVSSCGGTLNSSYPLITERRSACALPALPPGRYVTNVSPTMLVVPDDGGTPSCE